LTQLENTRFFTLAHQNHPKIANEKRSAWHDVIRELDVDDEKGG